MGVVGGVMGISRAFEVDGTDSFLSFMLSTTFSFKQRTCISLDIQVIADDLSFIYLP